MRIVIKAEANDFEDEESFNTEITFSNDQLNNENFVDMLIGGNEYMLSVEDLYMVASLFWNIKQVRNSEEE